MAEVNRIARDMKKYYRQVQERFNFYTLYFGLLQNFFFEPPIPAIARDGDSYSNAETASYSGAAEAEETAAHDEPGPTYAKRLWAKVYDPEKGTCCGRSNKQVTIVLAVVVLYAVCALLFAFWLLVYVVDSLKDA